MSNPVKQPVYDVVERYDRPQGMYLVKWFRPDGYMAVDDRPIESRFNIAWPTDLAALDTLSTIRTIHELPSSESGDYATTDDDFIEGDTADVIRAVWRNEQLIGAFTLDGTVFDLCWEEPAQVGRWTEAKHARLSMNVKTLERPTIEAIIRATGIAAVCADAGPTLDQFAENVPALRQA